MKGVFAKISVPLLFLSILTSCTMGTIEKAVFTFDNQLPVDVNITADSGEDWNDFTITALTTTTVESENSVILFTAETADGVQLYKNALYGYTEDKSTRSYTIADNT